MADTQKKLNDEQTADNTTATDSANSTNTQANTNANDTQDNANTANDNAQAQGESVEAQIAELYIATFDRAPDEAGLEYWVDQYKNGMSVDDIAKSFFDQPETKEKYGATDIDSFIDSVYQNVLDRKPDDAGKDYWKAELEKGNISKDKFIIAILNGAKDHQDDAKHLQDKTDVGLTFVKEGLNDASLAKTVIEQFKALGDKDAVEKAIEDFAQDHKGEDKFDASELQDFSKLAENDHQELMKQQDNSATDNSAEDYKQNDDSASNVDDSYTSGDDSADSHNSDDQVQLAGTDDSDNTATGGSNTTVSSADGGTGAF